MIKSTFAVLLLGGLLVIAESAFAQAPTCNQVLTQDCLYFPSTRYAFTELERLTTYKDAAGALRTVKVLLRIPTAAPLPMPVVGPRWSKSIRPTRVGTTGSRRCRDCSR